MKTTLTAALLVGMMPAMTLPTLAQSPDGVSAYRQVLRDTVSMVSDASAQQLASKHGLNIVNVTWEDTGRYKGSSVGPNISDMTIQVASEDPETGKQSLFLMPVIRHPNFSDKTADIPLDQFHVLVGNEKGDALRKVTLKELLGDLRSYLSDGRSWKGQGTSLLAERDTHALVSAQAAFLPLPKQGEATFNPVLFNYQSYEGDPAVLTILATREGTSVTVIDNKRDGFSAGGVWGQRLFFNKDGERASLTGKRLSDFVAAGGTSDGPSATAAGQEGLNMVMLIQVPLKQKNPMTFKSMMFADGMLEGAVVADMPNARGGSDVEAAVIGHGAVEGPFTELDGLEIERDERFPVRVTVQFYKATSNGVVSAADMEEIDGQIARVYEDAAYVGSLVTEGETNRPTEYDGDKVEPAGWWGAFWQRYEQNMGLDRDQAMWLMSTLYEPGWVAWPFQQLVRFPAPELQEATE